MYFLLFCNDYGVFFISFVIFDFLVNEFRLYIELLERCRMKAKFAWRIWCCFLIALIRFKGKFEQTKIFCLLEMYFDFSSQKMKTIVKTMRNQLKFRKLETKSQNLNGYRDLRNENENENEKP